MTKAAVAGTFDILHDGHKALLSRAFEVGDTVVVGITSDRMAGEGREVSVPLHLRKAELERYLSGTSWLSRRRRWGTAGSSTTAGRPGG